MMITFEDEIWKPIITNHHNYTGMYEISNYGNIKSLFKIRFSGKNNKTKRIYPEQLLKPSKAGRYAIVALGFNGKMDYYTVHSLVWDAFGNKERSEDITIDHINENRYDNRIKNLQLMSRIDNARKGVHLHKISSLPIGVRKRNKKTYYAQATIKGKTYHLGTFRCATKAYFSYLLFMKKETGVLPCYA